MYKIYNYNFLFLKAFFKRKDTKWSDVIWHVQSLKAAKRDEVCSSTHNKDNFVLSWSVSKASFIW